MTSRSKKPTGGPAFPRAGNEWSDMEWVPAPGQAGMTLRDYFAAAALQGIQAKFGGFMPDWAELDSDIAEYCYEVADAMLKARDATP